MCSSIKWDYQYHFRALRWGLRKEHMKAPNLTPGHRVEAQNRVDFHPSFQFWESQVTTPIEIRMCWGEEKSSSFNLNCKYHYHHLEYSRPLSSGLLHPQQHAQQPTYPVSNPPNTADLHNTPFYKWRLWHSKWLTNCQSYSKESTPSGADTGEIVQKLREFSERWKNLKYSYI